MSARGGESPIKIAITQIEVVPGHPDVNLAKILSEIIKAKKGGAEIIVFPEMAVSGYLLGDEWENESFIADLMTKNEEIRKASSGIAVLWGNVWADYSAKGEDGRTRKYNAVFVAQNGKWVSNGVFEGHSFKTLLPKYREFDDERHFYSLAKLAVEKKTEIKELLRPFPIKTKMGEMKIGVMLCEDMWCDDYSVNPTKILFQNGANIMVNISCSPWTWRKNDKRNRVVKSLLTNSPAPFIYCNNVGIQNNGKNIFLFDGDSTAYDKEGNILKQASAYSEETLLVEIGNQKGKVINKVSPEKDVEELYNGLIYGIRKFFRSIGKDKVVIGLSGGIDSAVVTCLMKEALGDDSVFAVNMPSKFNSQLTQSAAEQLAKNLKIKYLVFPIQESVDLTVKELKTIPFLNVDDCSLENIQARDRGSRVLAGIAGSMEAVFTNNGNKTETALGYATIYGDVDGVVSPIGDIYKGEVYQLAKYINEINKKEIIPAEILEVVPSAELSPEQDVTKGLGDPILYPYHDKLIRAFVEFRKDPEDILKSYLNGTLEDELKLEYGLVKKYFATDRKFIEDLEEKWKLFKLNYFKRIQAPPIIVVSRRAFGFDLREAQNGAYLTDGFKKLKQRIMGAE